MRKREELALIKKEFKELGIEQDLICRLINKIKCFESLVDFERYLIALHHSFDIQLHSLFEKLSNK